MTPRACARGGDRARASARPGVLGAIVLVLAAGGPDAAAQGPDRAAAEALERRAKDTGELAAYVACGQAYLALYNQDPDGRGSEELLYDAAVCFEQGGSIGVAITTYTRLVELTGADREVRARAMAHLIGAYEQIAFYDQAAQVLERYADEYGATRPDAALALDRAAELRRGLGQHDRAIADTMKYVRLPSTSARDRAAAFFSVADLHEAHGDTGALIAHLRRYLEAHGAGGAPELRVAAHARLGQALWAQSCPVAPIDGSCLRVVRDRPRPGDGAGAPRGQAAPSTCGAASRLQVEVVTRDARLVREAQREFAAAIAVFERSGRPGQGYGRYLHALALFHQSEPAYEAYLRVEFPARLDFDPRAPAVAKASRAKLEQYLARKAAAGAVVQRGYEEVARTADAAMTLASIARRGQMQQHAADALAAADIPVRLRGDVQAVEGFCTTLQAVVGPLEASAAAAYAMCLDKSTALGWFSAWSRLCERQLEQLWPDRFPPARELRPVVAAPGVLTDVEAVGP